MKCLVTGGAGFIGSNLAEALANRGDVVRVLDNFSTGKRENLRGIADRVDVVEGDLRDYDSVRQACRQVDVIFHQGAMPSVPRSVEDPRTSFDVNAGGTLNVLLAAKENGVKRVVYAASSSAYGDTPTLPKREDMPQNPQSPYAADKLHGENLCRVFTKTMGVPCVALRYFNVFGPRQRPDSAYAAVIPKFIDAVLRRERPTIHGDGLQSRDFTFIRNVVMANMLAAEAPKAPGYVVNIGNGSRTTLLEVLDLICEAVGYKVGPNFESPRAGDVRDSQADISLATSVLDYRPPVDLRVGLRETVAWFRSAENL